MQTELAALDTAFGDLVELALDLDEETSWRRTGCPGWAVRDVVFHLLGDAQRALVALATPAGGPPDVDAVSYWRTAPGAPDPESRGIRGTRGAASLWGLSQLTGRYAETAAAVLALARRTAGDTVVATQGQRLTARDLVRTLVCEAAIHHLDLVVDLDRPGPRAGPLAVARATVDGLLGWSPSAAAADASWVLAATGRGPLSPELEQELGDAAARLPLLR